MGILHGTAFLHAGHIHWSKPIYHGIHITAFLGILPQITLDIYRYFSFTLRLHTIAGTCHCRQMSAGREASDAYETGIQSIFLSITAYIADGSLHIINLSGPFSITAAAMINTHHGK